MNSLCSTHAGGINTIQQGASQIAGAVGQQGPLAGTSGSTAGDFLGWFYKGWFSVAESVTEGSITGGACSDRQPVRQGKHGRALLVLMPCKFSDCDGLRSLPLCRPHPNPHPDKYKPRPRGPSSRAAEWAGRHHHTAGCAELTADRRGH